MDNVKYCGYCDHHFQKINKKFVKTIPAFRPTPAAEEAEGSPSASPDKLFSGGSKDPGKQPPTSSSSFNSKGKGKRGRKPGSMIYEPKLEPPKFNPDLASLNQSNNSLNSVNNSVTLTPVSNFNNLNHKSVNSFPNHNSDGAKVDRNLNDKANNKTPNVVVKIGKHGEVHHAKKDSPSHESLNSIPNDTEAILERVSANSDIKEETADKKGFTNANFSESFLPTSSVSVTASLIKNDSDKHHNHISDKPDTSRVKLEAPETLDAPSVSLVNVNNKTDSSRSSEPDTTNSGHGLSSHSSIPHHKGDLKITSSHNCYSNTPDTLSSSSNHMKSNSSVNSNMYNRPGLHSSVSLFPTNTGNHGNSHGNHISHANVASSKSDSSNSQPHTAVSIIPSVTSNSSSSLSSASSSLTVTPVDSSSSGPVQSNSLNITKSHNNESVTISSVSNEDRLKLETLNQSKNGAINNSQNKVEKVGNGPVKRLGRPPKKGTHTTTSSLGNVISLDSEDEDGSSSKRPRTDTDADKLEEKVIKKEETESGIHKFMMFGATLNPTSGMAKEMSTVLQVIYQLIYYFLRFFGFTQKIIY